MLTEKAVSQTVTTLAENLERLTSIVTKLKDANEATQKALVDEAHEVSISLSKIEDAYPAVIAKNEHDATHAMDSAKMEDAVALTTLTEGLERLTSVINKLKEAGGEKMPEGDFGKLLAEIAAIGKLIAGVKEKYPAPAAMSKTESDAASTSTETVTPPPVKPEPDSTQSGATLGADIEEVAKALASASTSADAPTQEAITELAKKLDGVFPRGGVMIDATDMDSLQQLIGAILGALDDSVVEKRAGRMSRILTEAAERALSLANRVKSMDAPSAKEMRELKAIHTLLMGLASKYPSATAKKEPGISASEAERMINEAVAKAVEPLNSELATLKKSNGDLRQALTKAEARPGDRVTSPEMNGSSESRLFPLDYNA